MEKTFTRVNEIVSKLDGDFIETALTHTHGTTKAKVYISDPQQHYQAYENNDGRAILTYQDADSIEALGLMLVEFAAEMRKRQ